MSPSQRSWAADRRRARFAGLFAIVALVLAAAGPSRTDDAPAPPTDDTLMRLVPADAGLILTIDGFRDRSRAILETRIAREFQRLPAFKAWLDSPNVRNFLTARKHIEDFLETSFDEIGDEIFGDAVALALIAPSGPPADARGLLALRARDPRLLKRLLDRINQAQKTSGELAEVAERERGGLAYVTRRYQAHAGRPDETYVLFPDGVFALSNAESLIQWVIDRKAAPEGDSAADLADFHKVAARLPKSAAARLFLNGGLARRVAANLPSDDSPESRRTLELIRGYSEAIEFVGAGLVVDDSAITIQVAQALDPDKFDELTGWWTSPPSPERAGPGPRLDSIPPSTLALASLSVDVPSLYRSLVGLAPERDRANLEKMEIVASGLLLGLDLRTRVLPALGPWIVAYLEAPLGDATEPTLKGFPLPLVVATEIREPADRETGAPSATSALDNALRVILAALALDGSRVGPESRLEVRHGVTALSVPFPFAFAVDRPGRRMAVGSSAQAVARYLEADVDPDAGSRFRGLRQAAFPDYKSFICLDLAALHDLAARHKDRLVALAAKQRNRPAQDAARDLDQVMALVRLFDAAFLAGRVDPSASLVEHSLGLIPRPGEGKSDTETKP